MNITIVVVDGMGGGIGAEIVSRVRREFGNDVSVIALGTNAVATEKMLQAGADRGASGENALRCTVTQGDFILGPFGIVLPNGLMGEVTKEAAETVMSARGRKILIPVNHPRLCLAGLANTPLSELIQEAIAALRAAVDGG
jgi:NAD(P)-dependent dehydrogenase (short-subunit alcohol dehydrogenase family)